MSLSCSCGNDYEWYYALTDLDYSACSTSTCYGCGKPIKIGDPVARIIGFEHDEDGEEINDEILGRMCEPCIDMVDNLKELGYCLDANPMYVTKAHAEYLELLPRRHRTTVKEEK